MGGLLNMLEEFAVTLLERAQPDGIAAGFDTPPLFQRQDGLDAARDGLRAKVSVFEGEAAFLEFEHENIRRGTQLERAQLALAADGAGRGPGRRFRRSEPRP